MQQPQRRAAASPSRRQHPWLRRERFYYESGAGSLAGRPEWNADQHDLSVLRCNDSERVRARGGGKNG